MAQSLSKIHIRMNAFALPGRTTQHIHTIPRVSLRLPWAMRSLGFAMHYWLHLSNSSMLDCIRFERSFSPFETKSETLVIIIGGAHRKRRHESLVGYKELPNFASPKDTPFEKQSVNPELPTHNKNTINRQCLQS